MLNGKNVIEEFYFGNLDAAEGYFDPSPEYTALQNAAVEKEEALLGTLNEEQAERYQQYLAAASAFSCMEDARTFINGWTLAARFILDTFLASGYTRRQD